MPRDRRPAVVLVVAILNMIFGGMNLLSIICCVPFMVLFAQLPFPGGNPYMMMYESLEKRIPHLPFLMVGNLLYSLILSGALVGSGYGLWKMRPWARRVAIGYAVVALINVVIGLVVNLVWMSPIMTGLLEDLAARQPNPNAPPPPNLVSPGMIIAGSVFGTIVGSIYPIAILVMMFLPHVRAAFAGGQAPEISMEEEIPEVLDAGTAITERRDSVT